MADVNPIPEGYPRVMPYLHVSGGAEAIDFYTKVLGASERMRMPGPDGKIGHAELELGDSIIMLADEAEEVGALAPRTVGGTPVTIHTYVEDVDTTFRAALDAGATSVRDPEDQFYGDRNGTFEDPFGHRWSIATHVEDVAPEEMERRMNEMMAGRKGAAPGRA
jgi:PhnB protein